MKRGPLGNERYQEHMKLLAENRRRQLDTDLAEVMATRGGRRVLWWLIDGVAKVSAPTFTGNSQTFHLEGRRSVGIELQAELQRVAPAEFVLALQEELAVRRDEDLHRQTALKGAEETEE